jgi:hypothetical protein
VRQVRADIARLRGRAGDDPAAATTGRHRP